jgi:hypothetical protein
MTMGSPVTIVQGQNAPNVVVDNAAFVQATRRQRYAMQGVKAWSGIGATDSVQLKQEGVVAQLECRVSGTITLGGTIGTTTASYDFPYNIVQNFQLSANGQSNLVSARGLTVKLLDFVQNSDLTDRGVSRSFGGAGTQAIYNQGTCSLSSEDWGTNSTTVAAGNVLAPGYNTPTVGAHTFDVTYVIPVAADQVSLIGAIYAQSAATNLNLNVQWATQSQLFSAVGASATVAYSINWDVTGVVYSIPQVGNAMVIPDLSQFHQVTEFRQGGLTQNVNEINLPGVGTGRYMMRAGFQVSSGSTPAPLAMTDANFSQVSWGYGGNTVPETYASGSKLRSLNERQFSSDIGKLWGHALWDFSSQFALRDLVDQGSTANLRLFIGLVASPTAGFAQVWQQTLFAANTGA